MLIGATIYCFIKTNDVNSRAFAMVFFNTTTITYSLAYFLPIILNTNLGFSVGASQCLVAPPYAFAGLVMYGMGWLGDRYHVRGPSKQPSELLIPALHMALLYEAVTDLRIPQSSLAI